MLGTSSIAVPFAFPNGSIAKHMAVGQVIVSSSRVNQLVALYWDGIDEGSIQPIMPGALNGAVVRYLKQKGVDPMEAGAFVNAMRDLKDQQWLLPRWSLLKAISQDVTSTGYTGSAGSKAFNIQKMAYIGIVGLALIYLGPAIAPALRRVLK